MSADYCKTLWSIQKAVELFNWYQKDTLNGDYGQPNSDYVKFNNENNLEFTVWNLDYCMQSSPRIVVSTKDIIWNQTKRFIKDKLNECQSIINNFILSKTNILDKSTGIYKHVREDFVKLLSINPNAVSKYMRWRFRLHQT